MISIAEEYTEGWNINSRRLPIYERFRRAINGGHLISSAYNYTQQHIDNKMLPLHHLIRGNTFILNGIKYQYYIKKDAVLAERIVEYPIASSFYQENKHDVVLEVGNTMHNAMSVPNGYDVLDKYETGGGVINKDAVDYKSNKKYDMIISVSTMEHFGFDEPEKDPNKPLVAIRNIEKLLKPKGKMLITVPLGYNPAIDRMIRERSIKFTRSYFLKRISHWNYWAQTDAKDALSLKYNSKYACANSLAILIKIKR